MEKISECLFLLHKSVFSIAYDSIISIENLLLAWKEFLCGKRQRKDVRTLEMRFADTVFELHDSLKLSVYKHGAYLKFIINDPKKRTIHKARVRDRLLHHAIHRQLYPLYNRVFISDSYSCRKEKGIHGALERFKIFSKKASRNNTRTTWVLKCDIRKFLDSIDHGVLMSLLEERITDVRITGLLRNIIDSFKKSPDQKREQKRQQSYVTILLWTLESREC